MVSIPFGIVGAVLGHLLLNYSLSLISLFGVVALSGVVVNDALVFIDFANQRRRSGMPLIDAVRSAGIQRFRPIILTTLTTFFGLMPMIIETSRQARFLIPMAISLGFGILFATAITLLLIPSLMLILEDIGICLNGSVYNLTQRTLIFVYLFIYNQMRIFGCFQHFIDRIFKSLLNDFFTICSSRSQTLL